MGWTLFTPALLAAVPNVSAFFFVAGSSLLVGVGFERGLHYAYRGIFKSSRIRRSTPYPFRRLRRKAHLQEALFKLSDVSPTALQEGLPVFVLIFGTPMPV